MTLRNDKVRDLTPLVTTFTPGESPTAAKLQGMMRQADAAIAYLENTLGDLKGEEGAFSTWATTLARNLGDFSEINPRILPNLEIENYEQNLTIGKSEHELDMIPIGELATLLNGSLDSSVVPGQYKDQPEDLEAPGDWTISYSYLENNRVKRGRKLVTHSPAEGGSITFNLVTSGRGSSVEDTLENTIPNLAQAEDDGSFATIQLIDTFSKTYEVTLPFREKMYNENHEIVDFSASNTKSNIGIGTQYELPPFFFGANGLSLELDGGDGFPQDIPLNLIKLYDWDTKKEIEGIVSLTAAASSTSRKFQFMFRTEQDVILDVVSGRYIIVVPGNTVTKQLEGLVETVYQNPGVGHDMTRLLNHKNLMNLRTTSEQFLEISRYYGTSNIVNNDHSMYFHRDGYTDTDKGAGANVIRGNVVVGNTSTGVDDNIHENFNVDSDSYSIYLGNILAGGEIKYAKAETYTLDHEAGGLPLGIVDAGLMIVGAQSDLDPLRKNIFLEGDIRTSGNIVLGRDTDDVVFLNGKTYLNDELTFIPRTISGIIPEEGKVIYSSVEKTLIWHNGNEWLSPWNFSGFDTVIGDGVTSFGKYNGTDITPFNAALTEVASGGFIKVLPGTYNFLGNRIFIPANVTLEGSGDRSILKGTSVIVETSGNGSVFRGFKVEDGTSAYSSDHEDSVIENLTFLNSETAVDIGPGAINFRALDNIVFNSCDRTIQYSGSNVIKTFETVTRNATAYSKSTVNDWSLKEEVLAEYNYPSNMSIVIDSAESAIGADCFNVSGTGSITCKRFLPVNESVGIAGHINVKRVGATGNLSVGVICYDKDYQNIGTRNFIISNSTVGSGALESQFYKGMMIGNTGYVGLMFPAGTKFIKPTILISGNDAGIRFDSFEVFNLTYSRSSSWS
jgi:hypothetical protein